MQSSQLRDFERRIMPHLDAAYSLARFLVRNEQDWKPVEVKLGQLKLEAALTDESPLEGENRYYLRVEQDDGSMGWSSPVWVKFAR